MKNRLIFKLMILLAIASCKKEKEIEYNKIDNEFLVDTIRVIDLDHPYNNIFNTYEYDDENNIMHIRKMNEVEQEVWYYDYYIEKINNKLLVKLYQNDSILVEKNTYTLNEDGNIVYDSLNSNSFYYNNGYLIKRISLIDSSFYFYQSGNLIKDSTIESLPDTVTPFFYDTIYTYNYEYFSKNNYLNNAFYNLNSKPYMFFLGKSTKKLIFKKQRIDMNPVSTIIGERFTYDFDNQLRTTGVTREFQYQSLEWHENMKLEIIYKQN